MDNRKRSTGCDEDRLSSLPDSLLHNILSLVSTKEATRTSILALRWRTLWTSVLCLDLDIEQFSNYYDFMDVMDRFLNLRGNSYLQKFLLRCAILEHDRPRFKSWIDIAVMCKVEHLDVKTRVRYIGGVKMPQSLFLCNTLVVLKLFRVGVDVPVHVSLSSLKFMHLEEVVYADDSDIRNLISGCTVLEKLSIVRSYQDNVKVWYICSRTLKWLQTEFSVIGLGPTPDHGYVIDAPHLEYMSLGDHHAENYVLNNLGSSLKAEIDVSFDLDCADIPEVYDLPKRSRIRKFLLGISNIKSLSFSQFALQVLSQYFVFESLPQFHGVIHLETTFGGYAWEVLPALLVCCPNLKSFALGLDCTDKYEPVTLPLPPPKCLSSLESVAIETHIVRDKAEVDIIKYFLGNAAVLKEMKIDLDISIPEESAFLNEVLTFPRLSSECQILAELSLCSHESPRPNE